MIAYVQQKEGQWLSPSSYACWKAFSERGDDVIPFEYRQLRDGELALSRETIVHGGVQAVRKALAILEVPMPPNIDLPEQVLPFCGRKTWTSTMSKVRQIERYDPPIHVKPLHGHKEFTGRVLKRRDDLLFLTSVPGEVEVLVQEYVDFRSEWRFYVLRRQVVGAGYYTGDPMLVPDSRVVSAALEAYDTGPIAHSLDVGVVADGRTLVIEVNDAFSLGFYGLSVYKYAEMIESRWNEMTKEV